MREVCGGRVRLAGTEEISSSESARDFASILRLGFQKGRRVTESAGRLDSLPRGTSSEIVRDIASIAFLFDLTYILYISGSSLGGGGRCAPHARKGEWVTRSAGRVDSLLTELLGELGEALPAGQACILGVLELQALIFSVQGTAQHSTAPHRNAPHNNTNIRS